MKRGNCIRQMKKAHLQIAEKVFKNNLSVKIFYINFKHDKYLRLTIFLITKSWTVSALKVTISELLKR